MLEIAFPIFMILVYLGIAAWAIAYICSFGLLGLRGVFTDFSSFSVGGFSVRRIASILAYVFMVFNALLTPLHWWVDWRGDGVIMGIVAVLSLATLALGFLVSKDRHGRFLPFAFCIIFFINHSLLCKA